MEILKNWAFSICCASIAGGILNLFIPKGGTQAIYKTVFCVFFLCIVISPLADIRFPDVDIFNPEITENETFENTFSATSEKYLENEIIASVEEILKNENIICDDIFVKVNISEDGSININKFVLTFKQLENADRLAEKIGRISGITPEILILGVNKNE